MIDKEVRNCMHTNKQQIILAVSGVKNAGKTTLIERILPNLQANHLNVAVIKHDGHSFLSDPIDTDTGKYMQAGAFGTAIFDGEKYKVIKRVEVDENTLIKVFPEADLILLEGFKDSSWPKVEIIRAGNSECSVCRKETLLAIITDLSLEEMDVPVISLNDIDGVIDFILQYIKNSEQKRVINTYDKK